MHTIDTFTGCVMLQPREKCLVFLGERNRWNLVFGLRITFLSSRATGIRTSVWVFRWLKPNEKFALFAYPKQSSFTISASNIFHSKNHALRAKGIKTCIFYFRSVHFYFAAAIQQLIVIPVASPAGDYYYLPTDGDATMKKHENPHRNE